MYLSLAENFIEIPHTNSLPKHFYVLHSYNFKILFQKSFVSQSSRFIKQFSLIEPLKALQVSFFFKYFFIFAEWRNFHCVKSVLIRSYSGPYFPAFGLNTERYGVSLRIHCECREIWTIITPNTDSFYAVFKVFFFVAHIIKEVDPAGYLPTKE